MATKETSNAPKEAVMYLGASLNGERHVVHGAVFVGGKLPDHLEQAVKKDDDFSALFVPLSKAGAAKRELANPNSAIAKAIAATRG